MHKRIISIFVVITFLITALFLTACNDNDTADNQATSYNGNNSNMDSSVDENHTEMNQSANEADNANNDSANSDDTGTEETNENSAENNERSTADSESDRMVIYTADMRVAINDFKKAQNDVQTLIDESDGYVVDSSASSSEDGNQQGQISARIPEETFEEFLDQVEEIADEVEERNVSGEDVTKEYVDLESRLDAKKEVEERLESLMEDAEESEDLLDISDKLEDIQEEIERIKGEMEYLENHSAMSTVHISMTEEKVNVGDVKDKGDLNTWQKTKKAFVTSTNAIITFFSSIVVFLVGYSPILAPIIIIAAVIYWLYRRKRKKEQ